MSVLGHLNVVVGTVGVVDVVYAVVAVSFMHLRIVRTVVFHHVFVGEFVRDVLKLERGQELEVRLLDLVNYLLQFLLQVLLPQLLLCFHRRLLVASHFALFIFKTNIIMEVTTFGNSFF